jgi:hypothetical protein
MLRALPFVAILWLCPTGSWAQQAAGPKWIELSLRPAGLPSPVMKYQLLPESLDVTPGNAALLYHRANNPEHQGYRRHPEYEKSWEWLELPLDKFPREKARGILPRWLLDEVDLAARRETCDWEMTARARKDGFLMVLPDIQGFREYARLLGFRARLELLDGRFDKAAYTLQTGLALSRHVSEAPTLINSLVGMAIATIMLDRAQEMVQLPKAPNLYWALADLPRPFIDLRKPMQGEKIMVEALFPGLRASLTDPASPPWTPQQLRKPLEQFALLGLTSRADTELRLVLAVAAARIYPEAKQFLQEQGRTARQVEALPVVQVALMHALTEYDRLYGEMYKWQSFPYWEARPGLLEATRQLRQAKSRDFEFHGISIASLAPAVEAVFLARVRVDRRIAALRCVEAIRLHAASHDGALPGTLGDIKEVPIPIDPVTGKSFEYTLEQDKARLQGPPPPGTVASTANTLRYGLRIVSPKKGPTR